MCHPLKVVTTNLLETSTGVEEKAYTRLSLSTYLQIEGGDRKLDNALTYLPLTETHQSSRNKANKFLQCATHGRWRWPMSAELERGVEEKPKQDLTVNLPKSEEAIESLTVQ